MSAHSAQIRSMFSFSLSVKKNLFEGKGRCSPTAHRYTAALPAHLLLVSFMRSGFPLRFILLDCRGKKEFVLLSVGAVFRYTISSVGWGMFKGTLLWVLSICAECAIAWVNSL